MTVLVKFRQGIGRDIEYNEENCYVVQDDDGDLSMVCFAGMIINLPFIKIFFGDFFDVDEE